MTHKLIAAFFSTILAASLTLSPATFAQGGAPTLRVGDTAPPLGNDVKWLKGDAIPAFEEGHVYVLDFWATWCGPCIAGIPHLSEVADTYRGKATVVGLAVLPRSGMVPTDEYVQRRGDDMRYTVGEDIGDRIARRYIEASNARGLPTVMIVNQEGRIAWMGHPQQGMDEALEQIVEGTYDLELVVRRTMLIDEAQGKLQRANQLAMGGNWNDALRLIDEVVESDPELFGEYALVKYQVVLGQMRDAKLAEEYQPRMLEIIHENPFLQENLARFLIEAPGLPRRDLDLALKAAERSVELTRSQWARGLAMLAMVHDARSEHTKAVEAMRKAIDVADPAEDDVSRMRTRLADFEAAARRGG